MVWIAFVWLDRIQLSIDFDLNSLLINESKLPRAVAINFYTLADIWNLMILLYAENSAIHYSIFTLKERSWTIIHYFRSIFVLPAMRNMKPMANDVTGYEINFKLIFLCDLTPLKCSYKLENAVNNNNNNNIQPNSDENNVNALRKLFHPASGADKKCFSAKTLKRVQKTFSIAFPIHQ